MEALLAAGDRERVVEALFRELLQMSEEDVAAFKAAASSPSRIAAAHTITRKIRGEPEARLNPEFAAEITVPMVLVTGEHSADPARAHIETVEEALPDARIAVLEGQEHVADVLAPETFAEKPISWLRDPR
jgi:pimeloyl-ACP methyl ester carboxylesterase